jgi:hypothetical protein
MDLQLSLVRPQVPELGITVSLDEDSGAEIAEVLSGAGDLPAIINESTLEVSIGKAAEIKGLLIGIEQSRTAFKQPFFRAGQSIDNFAKRCSKSLNDAYSEITSRIAVYEGKRRAAEAEERARLDAEVAVLAKAAHNAANEQERATLIEQAQTVAIAAGQVAQPVAGMALTKQYEFILEDVQEVLRFNKNLLDIKVSHSRCMDLIRVMKDSGTTTFQIPGIRIVESTKAQVRGAR